MWRWDNDTQNYTYEGDPLGAARGMGLGLAIMVLLISSAVVAAAIWGAA
jgi:hypothetical protein